MTPATFGWIAIIVFVVAFDLWAIATGRRTLSAQFHYWFRTYTWFRVGSVLVALLLAFHLLVQPLLWP